MGYAVLHFTATLQVGSAWHLTIPRRPCSMGTSSAKVQERPALGSLSLDLQLGDPGKDPSY